jgi:hypothetical protein
MKDRCSKISIQCADSGPVTLPETHHFRRVDGPRLVSPARRHRFRFGCSRPESDPVDRRQEPRGAHGPHKSSVAHACSSRRAGCGGRGWARHRRLACRSVTASLVGRVARPGRLAGPWRDRESNGQRPARARSARSGCAVASTCRSGDEDKCRLFLSFFFKKNV